MAKKLLKRKDNVFLGCLMSIDGELQYMSPYNLFIDKDAFNQLMDECNNTFTIDKLKDEELLSILTEDTATVVSDEVLDLIKDFIDLDVFDYDELSKQYEEEAPLVLEMCNEDEDTVDIIFNYYISKNEMLESVEVYDVESRYFNDPDVFVKYKKDSKIKNLESLIKVDLTMSEPDSIINFDVPRPTVFNDYYQYPNIEQHLLIYKNPEGRRYLNRATWKDYMPDASDIVLGNPSNNNLCIQDNERDFYNKLCSRMDDFIKSDKPNVALNVLIESGYRSPTFMSYLENMINLALIATRKPTGKVRRASFPLKELSPELLAEQISYNYKNDTNEESDEAAGEEEALKDTGRSYYEADRVPKIDAVRAVMGYIESADGTYAPCEALVKLLRWGFRKPNKLKLDGASTYLDLEEFTVSNYDGDFSKLKQVVYEDGSTMFCYRNIGCMSSLKDMSGSLKEYSLPDKIKTLIGIECVVKYENTNIQEFIYIDLLTLLEEYVINKNSNFKVLGIEYEDGYFVTDDVFKERCNEEMINLATAIKNSESKEGFSVAVPNFINNKIKDEAKFSVSKGSITVFKLMQRLLTETNIKNAIKVNTFYNNEERQQAIAKGQCLSMTQSLSWELIETYVMTMFEVLKECEGQFDLEFILNMLNELMASVIENTTKINVSKNTITTPDKVKEVTNGFGTIPKKISTAFNQGAKPTYHKLKLGNSVVGLLETKDNNIKIIKYVEKGDIDSINTEETMSLYYSALKIIFNENYIRKTYKPLEKVEISFKGKTVICDYSEASSFFKIIVRLFNGE